MAQPQKVDVVCLHVLDGSGVPLAQYAPVSETQCTPVPPNVTGGAMQYHLFALVTQRLRGELGVVDLTNGQVVDEDRTTPGINLIPVGLQPTDVVVAPDAQLTFVSTAADGMTGIDVIENTRLLGDSTGSPALPPLGLSDLMGCSLPVAPVALSTIAAPSGSPGTAYYLVALLAGSGGSPGAMVTIDPTGFQETLDDAGATGAVAPGSFSPCKIVGRTSISGVLPGATWTPGPTWPDGVPYAEAGDLRDGEPSLGLACSGGSLTAGDGGTEASSGAPVDASADGQGGGQAIAFPSGSAAFPTAMVMRNDGRPLAYVADGALPLIHVIDFSFPARPVELDPLLTTSVDNPSRVVSVGWVALSPSTRDYKRYLYAVDTADGSVMVFDVTDPDASPHVPLRRPHAELNPLIPVDRLKFSAPAAAVVFAQHDWPVLSPATPSDTVNEFTGLLCNPNPNAHPNDTTFLDVGAYYRADQTSVVQAQEGITPTLPYRLRGVFAFVTLSNGTMVVVDVDDWDAPCRRPDPMSTDPDAGEGIVGLTAGMTGQLDIPELPATDANDLDPYHAPLVFAAGPNITPPTTSGVTLEAFFPVSAPHRVRSSLLLAQSGGGGVVLPALSGQPQLFDVNGAPLSVSAGIGQRNPLILATPLPAGFFDPDYVNNSLAPHPSDRSALSIPAVAPGTPPPPPSVRISFDDPTVHQTQDWTVTYEGALPSVIGISSDLMTSDNYHTLTLNASGAQLCSRGIEDWDVGQSRVAEVLAARGAASIPVDAVPIDPASWTADYVEFTDDLLASTDQYWSLPSSDANDCWNDINGGALADPPNSTGPSVHAADRYNFCFASYDAAVNADTHFSRDFPILRAYDNEVVIGRFAWDPGPDSANPLPELTTNRTIVGSDPSNVPFLEQARCCFHHQAAFKVRTGGEWVAVGTENVGLLHHVSADGSSAADGNSGGRCVLSCNPKDVLLNARAFDVPWADSTCAPLPTGAASIVTDRNSPLAMRNPMLSFVMWAGCGALPSVGGQTYDHTLNARDSVWRFAVGPGFSPLTVAIGQVSGSPASPQSMRYINSLGQIAVVDGSLQGLILYDLNTIAIGGGPYY